MHKTHQQVNKSDYIMCADANEAVETFRTMIAPFDAFSTSLAEGALSLFAPPFDSYASFTGDIIDYYHDFFKQYLDCLEEIDAEVWNRVNMTMHILIGRYSGKKVQFDLLQETKELSNAILTSINAYFNGSPRGAYEVLEQVLIDKECHLLNIIPQIEYKGILYRVRNKRGLFQQKDLFHPPFEKRNACGSYRYSILGYPSLYLAGSVETALAENRIVDDKYSAMAFRSKDVLRCVDLSLPNRDLVFWERYSLVLFYPLIVACSLKVKDEGGAFKPEYVIPQILFQIVKEHSNLQGISYTSTRSESPDFQDRRQRNFVLIVPNATQAKGQSPELAGLFRCTEPISPKEREDACDFEKRLNGKDLEELKLADADE